ncbi:sensor histidine kinase [Fusobacterium sp. PH5-44]|uniref:sensor histidine kinase n=1 Tax=unclassified Fusobacterium TaxID=2648384 RepID=UPI003D23CDB9
MKNLSNELQKSYSIIIIIFFFSFIGLLYIFGNYIIDTSKADIRTVESFINYELNELHDEVSEALSVENFLKGALEECPHVPDLHVIFQYKDKVFATNDNFPKNLKLETTDNNIYKLGFYDYYYINRIVNINGIDPIEVIIIKNLKEDKKIFTKTTAIACIWIVATILISIIISKKSYSRFVKPLKNIQEITNEINLDSLNNDINYYNEFYEFTQIILAYKNMLKRLKEQTNAQIDFVNNASHELKTPIFIIGGYIDLVNRWGFKDETIVKEALTSIKEENANMGILVNKLLFLAKDTSNIIEIKEINLSLIIKEILNNLKIIYPDQSINFLEKSVSIKSDYALVKQLFINLIDNAIKYGNSFPIDINITIEQHVTVTIEDKGIGILDKDLNHIFDKFYRVDKSRDRTDKNHGLGLSIVKKIIDILKGDLEIKSQIGKGTIVIITLPFSIE